MILISCDRQLTLFFLLQAGGTNERRARRGRGGPKFLETVAEDTDELKDQQKEEEESMSVPEPSPAPVVEAPKPAAKVTRAKRGKKVKDDLIEKHTDDPVAMPEEPAQDGKLSSIPAVFPLGKFFIIHLGFF